MQLFWPKMFTHSTERHEIVNIQCSWSLKCHQNYISVSVNEVLLLYNPIKQAHGFVVICFVVVLSADPRDLC